MNGKITREGELLVERPQGFRACGCPCLSSDEHGLRKTCGDWCPAFREPFMTSETKFIDEDPSTPFPGELKTVEVLTGGATLHLCSQVGTLIFVCFEDNRIPKEVPDE